MSTNTIANLSAPQSPFSPPAAFPAADSETSLGNAPREVSAGIFDSAETSLGVFPREVSISPSHRKEFHASTWTDETIAELGVCSVSPINDLGQRMGYNNVQECLNLGGILFPYFDAEGNIDPTYFRVKPSFPRNNKKGDPIKYEAPRGKPPRAYIPPRVRRLLNSGADEIDLVEGIKKAGALMQLGRAVIGIDGVYAWKMKYEDRLIPDLEAIDWNGKTVFITFDNDPKHKTRKYVLNAAKKLAALLKKAGAKAVYFRMPPPAEDGEKNGIDDWLATIPTEERIVRLKDLLEAALLLDVEYSSVFKNTGLRQNSWEKNRESSDRR